MKFPNVVLPGPGPMPYADVGAALEQSMVTLGGSPLDSRSLDGPIVVKGVHIGEDARRAVDEGADAIVVSNHGGRQLDGVSADDCAPARSRRRGRRRASKCCSTAASGAAATSSKRCASAPAPS